MAELQWVIEVRCVNALLAQIKVGETGQHFIVEIPAGRNFDPPEFEKLIEGVKYAKELGSGFYAKLKKKKQTAQEVTQLPDEIKIVEKRELYSIQLLSNGELALVTIKDSFFAPSELNQFLIDIVKAKQQMDKLREQH
jgi:hypothetical protein